MYGAAYKDAQEKDPTLEIGRDKRVDTGEVKPKKPKKVKVELNKTTILNEQALEVIKEPEVA